MEITLAAYNFFLASESYNRILVWEVHSMHWIDRRKLVWLVFVCKIIFTSLVGDSLASEISKKYTHYNWDRYQYLFGLRKSGEDNWSLSSCMQVVSVHFLQVTWKRYINKKDG